MLQLVERLLARAGGMEIHAQKEAACSFFSSPYQAHRDFAAVDICAGKKFGETALSPVSGEIIKTMSFDSPSPFRKSLPEHLICIRKGGFVARLMHVKPDVNPGDVISVGDELGTYISNGFFSYWVEPIIHVEIRKEDNLLRPTGGLELEPVLEEKKAPVCKRITGTVASSWPRNASVMLDQAVSCAVDGVPSLIDCATNLDYAGVHGNFQLGGEVTLNGVSLGEVIRQGRYASIYRTKPLYISVNDNVFCGMQLAPGSREIRLLPARYGETRLKVGDRIEIKIRC